MRGNLDLKSYLLLRRKNPFTGVSETVSYFDNRSLLRSEISRWLLLLRSVSLGGIVHLNNGRFITPFFGDGTHPKESLFPKPLRKMIRLYALGLLRSEIALHRLGAKKKAIFLTFQGSDARETQCFVEKHQQSGLAAEVIGRSGKTNGSIRRKKMLLTGSRRQNLFPQP